MASSSYEAFGLRPPRRRLGGGSSLPLRLTISVTNFFLPWSSKLMVVYWGSTAVITPRPYFS